ncbi:MKI67 FHA domain-interacting nucleolar phosphoprotein [Drosophila tropicalis]|uniref:MKI67 FHA domain-interacting nucleolar phosphoprotein n=1 Tax=Drosophila tropicalis TaxID=46794 RepID=UPI0035ABC8CA
MPPVAKPKPQKIKKQVQATTKKTVANKTVVSGQLKKKLPSSQQKSQEPRNERGVVFIKHLPHGFFENQLRQYFKQFGRVLRVRLGRSPRTGGSKGFAFVEFEYPEVAKVAADTMDNYLMFQKVVKASYIPPEKQIYNYFKTSVKKVQNKAGKEIYVSEVTAATQRSVKRQNKWDESACQKRTLGSLSKVNQLNKKYKHLGIDFNSLLVKPTEKTKDEDEEPSTSSKAKHAKKEPKLEDLLGTTINEDSDDEDYVDAIESDEELTDEDDEEEEDLPTPPKRSQEVKENHLLKRKPGTGSIQKKKTIVKSTSSKINKKATQTLKLTAAKELAQPLRKVKAKKLKK